MALGCLRLQRVDVARLARGGEGPMVLGMGLEDMLVAILLPFLKPVAYLWIL